LVPGSASSNDLAQVGFIRGDIANLDANLDSFKGLHGLIPFLVAAFIHLLTFGVVADVWTQFGS
jgi:hypothetical protein